MKADLHVHSIYSADGKVIPEKILESAIAAGLGCIAITDHNSFKAFFDVCDRKDIIVIPGEEVSSDAGHIIALGIDREIQKGLSIDETIEAIHLAGGYAFAAHPNRFGSGIPESKIEKANFDGIEALNARSSKRRNKNAKLLSERMNKPITCGSDSHESDTIGNGFLDLPDGIVTWQDALNAIMTSVNMPHSSNRTGFSFLKYQWKLLSDYAKRGFKRI